MSVALPPAHHAQLHAVSRATPSSFQPGGRVSVHGMVFFGDPRRALFMSHIPMFHSPHDVQVLFEVKLSDLAATKGPGLFTFKPEVMSLDDVVLGERTVLKGTLYRGNFESGGKPLEPLRVEVKRALRPAVLRHDGPALAQLEYLLVGSRENTFLVHKISRAPDFDQILPVHLDAGVLSDAELAAGLHVTVPARANTVEQRLSAGKVRVQVKGHARSLDLTVEPELSSLVGPDFTQAPP